MVSLTSELFLQASRQVYSLDERLFTRIEHYRFDVRRYLSLATSTPESREMCDRFVTDAYLNGCNIIVNSTVDAKLEQQVLHHTGVIHDSGGLEVRSDLGCQIGMQDENREKRRYHRYFEETGFQPDQGLFPDPESDRKSRLMMRFNPVHREAQHKHPGLNQTMNLPPAFSQFSGDFEHWNYEVVRLHDLLLEVIARGLGLAPDYLRDLMDPFHGPTLIAPTSMTIDVRPLKPGENRIQDKVWDVRIGSHADQGMTYHGRSPEALILLTPDKYRFLHKLEENERLIQYGLIPQSMFDWVGCMHQVGNLPSLIKRAEENDGVFKRRSITAFLHGNTLHSIATVPTRRTERTDVLYPDMTAGRLQYWNLKQTGLRIEPKTLEEFDYDMSEPPSYWGIR